MYMQSADYEIDNQIMRQIGEWAVFRQQQSRLTLKSIMC